MAKFRYRMQNILDIKIKLETQAKNAYGAANRKYIEEQAVLAELMLRRNNYEKKLKELMKGNINVKDVCNARNDLNSMKTLVRRQMVEVHKAELVLEEARKELSVIMTERKTHEKLRENALSQFLAEERAKESKEIDELVSFTFNSK